MRIKRIFFILLWILFIPLSSSIKNGVAAPNLTVSCQGCILIEGASGRILYEKNAHKQMRIASITKIMTALVAIEEGDLEAYVTISEEATRQIGSSIYAKPGEELRLIDLIYGLLLRSGNDTAYAIAEHIGDGDPGHFIYMMNERAKSLGMKNTVFENASGLDETSHNLSTAYDMALLMQEAIQNPIYLKINQARQHVADSKEGRRFVFNNKHRLINHYDYVTGGKTGYTRKANRTLVTSARKNGMDLIVVTLDDPNDWSDHIRLFDYGFETFKTHHLFDKGLVYVKELDRLFNLDESIQYPLSEEEIPDCEFIVDEQEGKYYLRLMHGEHILLSRELVDYNYFHDDIETFNEMPLTDKLKELMEGVAW